ncbi:MAG: hypothetical protein Q9225_005005 [Loekoesia sp. 1 TL-2023]
MGRRPNQLVLEYFDRGAKLEDNSNRYEHRCKACGEHFPKGRIETLTAHIEKKCPIIRREQPVPASSTAHQSPHPAPNSNGQTPEVPDHPNGQSATEHQLVLPVSSRRSLTGLEALAEASRQLEHPRKLDINPPSQDHPIDPDLERTSSIFRHSGFGTGLGDAEDYHAYSTPETDGSHAVSGAPISDPSQTSGHPYTGIQGSQDPAMLSLIAASASNLEATMPQNSEQHQDQEVLGSLQLAASHQTTASEAIMTQLENTPPRKSAANPATALSLDPVPGSLLHPSSASPNSDNFPKYPRRGSEKYHGRAQKVRGKFTDSRRQEVQNIRKKGACIRCRMLRKTVGFLKTPKYIHHLAK